MARSETGKGTVPLHTLRRHHHEEADTTYGKIGIKTWVCRGEILPTKNIQGEA